jgi:hypothetical protein
LRIAAHSVAVTGETESRDWRIIAMAASVGSAFIAARVTGRANARTGSNSTATNRPAGSEASGNASRATFATATTALSAPEW